MESNEKLLKKLNNGREYRAMRLEVRTADPAAPDSKQEVEGYACTFNQSYLLYEYMGDSGTTYRVMEQIDPHAFDDCDMDDVIMQYDHEGRVFARTKNGTLALAADGTGLKVTADLGGTEIEQERKWLQPGIWIGPAILSAVLLVVIVYAILGINDQGIDGAAINAKEVGIALFGPYVLAVELASMLLLAGLVVAFHIGREERAGEVLSNRLNDSDKRKTEEHA